jgi:hypothetical protein
MVGSLVEVLGSPGFGAVGFALSFVEESLTRSESQRPWVFLESSDDYQLFLPALPTALYNATQEAKLFWLKLNKKDKIPECVQMLLESGLFEGVFVRGFEFSRALAKTAHVWMRRWQLCAEKSHTTLLWWHKEESASMGSTIKLQWTAPGQVTLLRGMGSIEKTDWKVFQRLKQGKKEQGYERSGTNRTPERVA